MYFTKITKIFLLAILCIGYLGSGNIVRAADTPYEYEYDQSNRLVGVKQNGKYVQKYTYDVNGNLVGVVSENRANVQILSPIGTQQAPAIVESSQNEIAWTQNKGTESTLYKNYHIQVLNQYGEIVFDSGTLEQNTMNTTNSYILDESLPKDEKLQVRMRVADASGWSDWSTLQWMWINDNTNLLLNGGFETISGSNAASWQKEIPAEVTDLSVVSTPVKAGTKAQKLSASGLAQWESAVLKQSVTVEGGKAYKFSMGLNIEQLTKAQGRIYLRYYDANNVKLLDEQVNYPNLTNGYTDIEIYGKFPQNAASVEVRITLFASEAGASGTMYVDQVRLAYEEQTNLLLNGDFESTDAAGAFNWQKEIPAGTIDLSVASTPVKSGTKAQKLSASGLGQWGGAVIKQRVPVQGGEAYKFSAGLNIEQLTKAQGRIYLRYYDANNVKLLDEQVNYPNLTNGYTDIEIYGKFPQNAASVEVRITLFADNAGASGTMYIDQVRLTYEEQTNLFLNGDFESADAAGAINWQKEIPAGAIDLSVVSTPVKSGTKAQKLSASGMAQWGGAVIKQRVPVQGGAAYKFSAGLNIEQLTKAQGRIYLRYYDANNVKLLDEQVNYPNLTNGYTDIEIYGRFPDNAASVELRITLFADGAGASGTMYIDQVRLTYEEQTNLLLNGSFESADAAGAINWQKEVPFSPAISDLSVVKIPVTSGKSAQKLSASGMEQWASAVIKQRVPVQAGQAFKFSAGLNIAQLNQAQGRIYLRYYDASNVKLLDEQVNYTELTNGYAPIEIYREFPAAAASVEVRITLFAAQAGASGTIYIDDVKLEYEHEGLAAGVSSFYRSIDFVSFNDIQAFHTVESD